ncbi:tyrosine-type recombinase/integrase [Rhodospira trueperi]|uniref:Integrase n=1 Tax=Rhodospira trueperi TaxID=69960 RepID=A0A1G6X368_9PROT|nr:site-specific integrase [Rhodospira trueperi]SDD72561.1 Integrase [Rhodospira trueperi]
MRIGNKLSAAKVRALNEPGRYGDGNGLWLQVAAGAGGRMTKSWLFRYRFRGRYRAMGFGPVALVSLEEARQKATEARRMIHEGIDPLDQKRATEATERAQEASRVTFQDAAERYITAHAPGWKTDKQRQHWENTLALYAFPLIGALDVAHVDTPHLLKVLEPVWTEKHETASRVRGRIERILGWATTRGYRTGENPARWKGHLQHLLASPEKVAKVKHRPALPYADVPAFVTDLRQQGGVAARALEFTILTAARTGETIGAQWSEIDLNAETWIVPGERMKMEREHRVPLPPRAVEILRDMAATHDTEGFVFPGGKAGRGLSNMAMSVLLRRMGRDGLTVHGFRSSFRDWAAERTNYPSEMAEMALAHAVGDRVARAYLRADLFDRRRRLMVDWQRWCDGEIGTGDVVMLAEARA